MKIQHACPGPTDRNKIKQALAHVAAGSEFKGKAPMKPTHDLVRMAAAGGNLDLRTCTKPTVDLVQIAAAVAISHGRLVIGGNKAIEDLLQIVSAARGRVTVAFD
jgi:hypothetical protein